MEIKYTTKATSERGGRGGGRVTSTDGALRLDLAIPTDLGGPGGDATNPEQLFAAGYAACFHSALMKACREAKQSTRGSTVTAEVGIGVRESGGFGLAVTLEVRLPSVEPALVDQLTEAAHRTCPYSNAIRGNVEVAIEVAQRNGA